MTHQSTHALEMAKQVPFRVNIAAGKQVTCSASPDETLHLTQVALSKDWNSNFVDNWVSVYVVEGDDSSTLCTLSTVGLLQCPVVRLLTQIQTNAFVWRKLKQIFSCRTCLRSWTVHIGL